MSWKVPKMPPPPPMCFHPFDVSNSTFDHLFWGFKVYGTLGVFEKKCASDLNNWLWNWTFEQLIMK
jgi:hypothetical protein